MPMIPNISLRQIVPRVGLRRREIIDHSTDSRGIDERSRLLRAVRHNRLVDRFLDVSTRCLGRVELVDQEGVVDALYIGLDSKRIRCIVPVVALKNEQRISKHRYNKVSRYCKQLFPDFNFYPVFVQFLDDEYVDAIAMFALYQTEGIVRVLAESHFELIDIQDLIDPEEWPYASAQ